MISDLEDLQNEEHKLLEDLSLLRRKILKVKFEISEKELKEKILSYSLKLNESRILFYGPWQSDLNKYGFSNILHFNYPLCFDGRNIYKIKLPTTELESIFYSYVYDKLKSLLPIPIADIQKNSDINIIIRDNGSILSGTSEKAYISVYYNKNYVYP